MAKCLTKWKKEYVYLNKIVLSDQVTFHLSGKVKRHNIIIWGTENPHEVVEYVRDSPKLVFVSVKFCESIWSFFLRRTNSLVISTCLKTISCQSYSKIRTEISFFNKTGAPPHFHLAVTFVPQSHGCCLDWTWWNDSLATTIAWFNTPGLSCVGLR